MHSKLLVILYILHAINAIGFSQSVAPGGVGGVKWWFATEKASNQTAYWVNKIQDKPNNLVPSGTAHTEAASLLNFNPALYFGYGHTGIQIPLGLGDYSKSSYFSVFQPADAENESVVWSQAENGANQLILTTHRFADLSAIKYMNFVGWQPGLPGIYAYTQFKEKSPANSEKTLLVGTRSIAPVLPVSVFRGVLPEMIIYDRVLTTTEQAKVASYLAIKYGITLSALGTETYLSASGERIWDFKECWPYGNNIAGIGRDDASGLHQKQSESSNAPGLLTIGVNRIYLENSMNPAHIANNSFVLWGDNGAILDLEDKIQGQPVRLQRKWLVSAKGRGKNLETTLKFGAKHADPQPGPGEYWWLIIDRSGTGEFPVNEVAYRKGSGESETESVIFNDIQWDTDGSGHDIFTFSIGPALIPKIWISAPACSPATGGQLHVGAEGGRPPYEFVLRDAGGQTLQKWFSKTNGLYTIEDMEQGDYRIELKDADRHAYQEIIFIQASDAPVSPLQSKYELLPGQPLQLDAADKTHAAATTYHWSGPENFEQSGSAVTITEPGSYLLTIDHDGCISRQTIKVKPFLPDVFKEVLRYPNPTSDGRFFLKIKLHRAADVDLQISDASGRLISSQKMTGADRYQYAGQLKTSGVYTLTLHSELVSKTLQLIVNQ